MADDLCSSVAKAARQAMKARQEGVPIDQMMEQAEKFDGDTRELAKQMVLTAYERDRRFSPSMQEREVVEFGNEMYMHCTKLN